VEAFTEGVTAAGVDVVLLGLVSTDELFYATGALEAPAPCYRLAQPGALQRIKLCCPGQAGRDRVRAGRDPRRRERGSSG